MKPRVLLIGQSLQGGGAETRFRLLAKHLFGGSAHAAVLQLKGEDGHGVVDLGWSGRTSYWRVARKLSNLVDELTPDVVMSFGLFPNIVSALAVGLSSHDAKLVMSEITQPIAQARSSGWLRGNGYLLLARVFYRTCDMMTANSIDGLAEACALSGFPLSKAVRLPNVMDMSEVMARSEKTGDVPDGSYYVCINRLDAMKRVDSIIDAWGLLSGEIAARLVVVGDGEARGQLQVQVSKAGLDGRVVFVGEVENPLPYLARASGFIIASEYEGFSNAVLEAMCLGIPVVTSLCSSDARAMCAQGAALGFEVGDSVTLAQRVLGLDKSGMLVKDLLQNASIYRQPHLLPDSIRSYEAVVERNLSDHASGRLK